MSAAPSIVVRLPEGLSLTVDAPEAPASGDARHLLEREQTDHSSDSAST